MTGLAATEPVLHSGERPRITQKEADFYQANGYLVVADALTPDEVAALRMEAVRICRG